MRLSILALTTILGVTACDDEDSAHFDGTLRSDGYALFAVENNRQQRNDVTVTVTEADPGATYVLLYSRGAPTNAGWFAFDPTTKQRCGGEPGSHCEIPGYGYLVDVVTVPGAGAASVTLRDDRCGCDGDREDRDWIGHWAVMRIERTDRTNRIAFDVDTRKVKSYANEPEIKQLQ